MSKYITAGIGLMTVGAMLIMAAPLGIVSLELIGDTYVDEATPDDNHGGEDIIVISHPGVYAYLNFNIDLNPELEINSAELSLRQWGSITNPPLFEACEVLEPWLEDFITWNTRPTHDPECDPNDPEYKQIARMEGKYLTIDVTEIVSNWTTGDNYGFAVITGHGSNGIFYSSENINTTRQPKLTINYTDLEGVDDIVIVNNEDIDTDNGDGIVDDIDDDITSGTGIPIWVMAIIVIGIIILFIGIIHRR
jgi:sporulation protein YlmC with PRC-barrel domain